MWLLPSLQTMWSSTSCSSAQTCRPWQ